MWASPMLLTYFFHWTRVITNSPTQLPKVRTLTNKPSDTLVYRRLNAGRSRGRSSASDREWPKIYLGQNLRNFKIIQDWLYNQEQLGCSWLINYIAYIRILMFGRRVRPWHPGTHPPGFWSTEKRLLQFYFYKPP